MPLSSTIYVLAIPFFMFLFLGLVGVKMPRKITGVIGVLAMAVTTVLAYAIAITYFYGTGQGQVVDGVRQQIVTTDWSWLSFYADKLVVRLGILIFGILAITVEAGLGAILAFAWPFIPLVPIVAVFCAIVGVV